MKYYNLTGSQDFYGQKDKKTYYNVPANKVWAGMEYMCEYFSLNAVFVYEKVYGLPLNKYPYVGAYSRKYRNFRTPDGYIHKVFNF